MERHLCRARLMALGLLVAAALVSGQSTAEYYYSLDTTHALFVSDKYISVQLDTTASMILSDQFFAAHGTLDESFLPEALDRGFTIYAIAPGFDYDSCRVDLISDPIVSRAIPVYLFAADSMPVPVTDLISLRFEDGLSINSALGILADYGLHFVDSSLYRHMKWRVALDDTIKSSPLDYANILHVLDEVVWASPTMYGNPVLATVPNDPYFQYQYWLKNTGQSGGTVDADIDADSAWLFALADTICVTVVDDGGEGHEDLRFVGGRDFESDDDDPTPGNYRNHGMACAGIIGAITNNSQGMSGIQPKCKIQQVKIRDDGQDPAHGFRHLSSYDAIADAFYYLDTLTSVTSPIISNSWHFSFVSAVNPVQDAIREAGGCGPDSHPGHVIVFAAGNITPGSLQNVRFPANMPEVIAVGAINRSNDQWWYSASDSTLDLVAPVGDTELVGDMYTVDRSGTNRGWNPVITGGGVDNGVAVQYTKAMGGTSAACAEVAGIAALIWSRNQVNDLSDSCNPTQVVRDILINSADSVAGLVPNDYYGYGRANAFKALVAISHGDPTGHGLLDILDVSRTVDAAFRSTPNPLHPALTDLNCDGVTSIEDVVMMVGFAFRNEKSYPGPCYLGL